MPELLWGHPDLSAASNRETAWLWHGYIALRHITLLTSQWKSGKTTLLSVLLARMKSGGDLAGSRVSPARAVIVSEESPDHWLRRASALDLTDHVGWFCRPFNARPTLAEWTDLIDRLAALYTERSIRLVAIDPLASFLPAASENDSAGMLTALLPFQRLVRLGMALLLIHHPKKGETTSGQASRGSGALPSFADILIEMSILGKPGDQNRKRQLHAFSRDPETPSERVIELTADGRDYQNCGTLIDVEFTDHWPTVQSILENALHKLTRKEIRRAWAHKMAKPIVGVRTDIRRGGDDPRRSVNLMLAQSCDRFLELPLGERDNFRWIAQRIARLAQEIGTKLARVR
jgi:hypothetical protein